MQVFCQIDCLVSIQHADEKNTKGFAKKGTPCMGIRNAKQGEVFSVMHILSEGGRVGTRKNLIMCFKMHQTRWSQILCRPTNILF